MKLNMTIKIIVFVTLFILLAMSICCSKVYASEGINAYVAKKSEGRQLEVGKTYYVVE